MRGRAREREIQLRLWRHCLCRVPSSQPLKFLWRLLDEPKLRAVDEFQALLHG